MAFTLQQYLLTLIEQQIQNFGSTKPNEIQSMITLVVKNSESLISTPLLLNAGSGSPVWFMFLPDILLYCGIIVLIGLIGVNYYRLSPANLLMLLSAVSRILLVLALALLSWQWVLMFFKAPTLVPFSNLWLSYFGGVDWSCGVSIFNQALKVDIYTQTVKLVLIMIILCLYLYLPSMILSRQLVNLGELPLLLHISICLALTIISVTNFALLLLALEGFSLILYILTTMDRTLGGIIAAVKYFSFGTLGSVFLFWGAVHFYALVPSLSYNIMYFLLDYSNTYNSIPLGGSLSFASNLMLLGLLVKLGAAPLHQWVPDVYAGSHMLITAYFATAVKFLIFMIFCRLAYHCNIGSTVEIFASLSLIIGSILTLRQLEIKRFLAYSSITHVGFLLIGDLSASFIYILTYICSSLLFFSILLSARQCGHELVYISDLRFVKQGGLWNPLLLVLSLASMAGLPPFSGFFGKFLVWGSLIEDIYIFNDYYSYGLFILSVMLTLISIFYYMRIVAYVFASSDSSVVSSENSAVLDTDSVFQQQLGLSIIILLWVFVQPAVIGISLVVSHSVSVI